MKSLAGKRVLDLSRYVPGAYCSLVCAALGADVVKVEAPPNGDPMRELDTEAFDRLNRGKKSLALDLKSPLGAAGFRRLLPSADVLIESFRPGVMARLGWDYETVQRVVPGIVYVSISGYGHSGPLAERAGHDVNYMANAGSLAGLARPLPLQVADFASGGLYAVVAILAALLEGRGRYIDLAMVEGLLSMSMLSDGDAADRLSGRYPNYGVYVTQDGGALAVGALEQKFWGTFCEVIGHPEWAAHGNDPSVRPRVAELIASRTREDWEELFRGTDACVAPVRTPAEAAQHPQSGHRGYTRDTYQLPFGLPRDADSAGLGRAPNLGEHTEEILESLG